jgi:hypothetical protein
MGGVMAGMSLPIDVMDNCALPPNEMVDGSILCKAVPAAAAIVMPPSNRETTTAINALRAYGFTALTNP